MKIAIIGQQDFSCGPTFGLDLLAQLALPQPDSLHRIWRSSAICLGKSNSRLTLH